MEPAPRLKLSHRLTASLNAARATTAFYVVLHHLAKNRDWHSVGIIFRFGQEAVLVFFLLSGFVIFANEHFRISDTKSYALRRIKRIYPPLLIALVISTLVALTNHTLATDFHWRDLLGTLANLQDISALKPGVITDPYLHNDPLWSLSYETAFYLLFPLVMVFWKNHPARTNHAIGLITCLAYSVYALIPNHWALVIAYFLVWWVGAMAAQAYLNGARDFRALAPILAWLFVLCAISGIVAWFVPFNGIGFYPFLPCRHFVFAAFILIAFFGPLGRKIATVLERFAKPAAFAASLSYGIYVLHYPLLVQWHFTQSTGGLATAIWLLLILAYLSDRQLTLWMRKK